jgi:hypothetical protein
MLARYVIFVAKDIPIPFVTVPTGCIVVSDNFGLIKLKDTLLLPRVTICDLFL